MKPVMLTRKTSGTPRCSHSWMNWVALSAELDTRTPLLAICERPRDEEGQCASEDDEREQSEGTHDADLVTVDVSCAR